MDERSWEPAILNSKLLKGPRGLRVFEGRLYIADRHARVSYETSADLTDEELQVIPASAVKILDFFKEPYFVFPGLNGDIYATEHLNGCVFVFSGSEPRVRAGRPGYGNGGTDTSNARFMNPRGGAFDPETGILWLADHANDQIRLIEPNNAVSAIGTGASKTRDGTFENCTFKRPSDICYYHDGFFFVAEAYAIRRLDSKNRITKVLTGSPNEGGNVDGPPEVAKLGVLWSIALSGEHLFVTDVDAGKIRVIDLLGHVSTLEMKKTPELFGVAVTPHGHVLYTSQQSERIGIIPFVMDELSAQPISMEPLLDFEQMNFATVAGEKFPLPILQLAYPTLLTTSEDSYDDLKSKSGAVSEFINYLLSNRPLLNPKSSESKIVLEMLEKLNLPVIERGSNYRPSSTHLQQHLSALYRQTVIKDHSKPSPLQITLPESILTPLACNFTIVSSAGTEFPCHDWILYARWPFFRNLMKTGMIEQSSKRAELDELEDQTLSALLAFFYTNDLEIFRNAEVATDLLTYAQRFNIADMSSPPQPTEPAFKQLLARCRQVFDALPESLLPDLLALTIDYATSSQRTRINRILADAKTI